MNAQIQTRSITPCLWFNDNAEEAVSFYLEIFENATIDSVSRYGKHAPFPEGTILTISFTLNGVSFLALNGGPVFKFSEAVSFIVHCQTQKEVDHYWEKLSHEGIKQQCGWVKDRFGVSWQIVPRQVAQWMSDPDTAKSNRVLEALLKMTKLEIDVLQSAYDDK